MIEIFDPNDELERLQQKYRSKNLKELKRKAQYFDEIGIVACTACAKLILQEARRLGDDGVILDFDTYPGDDNAGHCVVVLNSMRSNDVVLNAGFGIFHTKRIAQNNGKDVTQEIMGTPLEELT